MTRKILLLLLTAALPLTACKKIKSLPFLEKKHSQVAIATPPPAPPPSLATPPPAPKPELTPVADKPKKPEVNTHATVVVFCYHNIEDKSAMKALTITTAEFEKELQTIKDAGYSVIGMQDFLAWRRGEKDIPPKSAIITLDDGWLSSYTNAWPILKKFGYPFTIFVYIRYVGSGGKSLTWAQLAEMRDAGVDIQSHSYSHSNLRIPGGGVDRKNHELIMQDVAKLGVDGWMKKEIVESKAILEKELGIKCNAFAYPFGIYNAKARELVKEAGYEAAFTVYGQQLRLSSPSDLLGRYAVEAAKPQIFADAIKGVGGGVVSDSSYSQPSVAQLAAVSMVTQPMEGETISNPTPTLKVNLATLGEVEPGSIQIRLSGVGTLPVKYDPSTKLVEAKVTQPLHEPNYSVILTATADGKKVETRWNFNFSADGKPVAPAVVNDAPEAAAPAPAAAPAKPKSKKR